MFGSTVLDVNAERFHDYVTMASAPISALISLVCAHQMLYKVMGLASLSMRAIYSGVEQHVVLPRIYGKYTAKEDV